MRERPTARPQCVPGVRGCVGSCSQSVGGLPVSRAGDGAVRWLWDPGSYGAFQGWASFLSRLVFPASQTSFSFQGLLAFPHSSFMRMHGTDLGLLSASSDFPWLSPCHVAIDGLSV